MASWHQELHSRHQHGFSRTFTALVCLQLILLPAVSIGAEFRVEWSPEGVRQYNESNPFIVELGDRITLVCPREGDYIYSNLWIQNHAEQFSKCDCMAVAGENCDDTVAMNGQCLPGAADVVINFRHNDAELGSVLNFNAGETYYLTSYAHEGTILGAFSNMSSGGQCLDGLRMVAEVLAIPTQPAATDMVEPSTEITEGPSDEVETEDSTEDDTSTEPSTESTVGTSNVTLEVLLLPSREILDWHVGLIAVLGVVVISFSVMVPIIVFFLYRRRGRLVVNPESSLVRGTVPEVSPEATYPVETFIDPLDDM